MLLRRRLGAALTSAVLRRAVAAARAARVHTGLFTANAANIRTGLFIDNEFVGAADGATFETVDPSTGAVIANVARASPVDVDRAVHAARRAFDGAWSAVKPVERGRLLLRLAEEIEKRNDDLAHLESLDSGKPLRDTKSYDVSSTAACFRYFAGLADKIQGDTIPFDDKFFAYTVREPVGVVGAIIPWNFPLEIMAWKLAPALCAGNTVVLKPSEHTPLTALAVADLARQVGFPAGVINVLPGFGTDCGGPLTLHPDVDKISFTGSVPTGKSVMRACAEVNIKRVTLELGGKSPNILLADIGDDDALFEHAVAQALYGCFYNNGQVCSAGTRVFVQRALVPRFVELARDLMRQHKIGNALDADVTQGPQISRGQAHKIAQFVRAGVSEGASVAYQGTFAVDANPGFFVNPVVFTGVLDHMSIAREEIFGPVLSVLEFDTIDEVIGRANASMYGLASAVWTRHIDIAQKFARRLRAGTVWLNCYNVSSQGIPFGGYKQSGFGRELGRAALEAYTETKAVVSATVLPTSRPISGAR